MPYVESDISKDLAMPESSYVATALSVSKMVF
jgi:hypothetical protein